MAAAALLTRLRRPLVAGAALVLALALPASGPTALAARPGPAQAPSSANAVVDWNDIASAATRAACVSPFDNPLHESRTFAIMHIAIHDALNAVSLRSTPYAYRGKARSANVERKGTKRSGSSSSCSVALA